MKLTLFLTFFFTLHAVADVFSQKVQITVKNQPLHEVLQQLRAQTGYAFLTDSRYLQQARPVSVNLQDTEISDALPIIFANQQLKYEITGKVILITPIPPASRVLSIDSPEEWDMHLVQQAKDIRGRVVDSLGAPILGTSVRVLQAGTRSTISQVATDRSGAFILKQVPLDAILQFTYMGYLSQELAASSFSGERVVVLKREDMTLSDVEINAGYYTVLDREHTGSISRVDAGIIQNQPVSNPLGALIGRMAGVNITQSTGLPGSGFSVEIRGRNSITGTSQPLYIVDGVPFSNEGMGSFSVGFILGTTNTNGGAYQSGLTPMVGISPADIESIEVLKDADATAIYGSRGANGVVLITTKRYNRSRSQFAVRYSHGMGKLTSRYDLMHTKEYLEFRQEAYRNDGIDVPSSAYDINGTWDPNRYTDWQEELVGSSAIQNNLQVSVQGGSELTNYLLTGTSYKETTVFPGDHANRKFSTRSVVNHQSADGRFQATANIAFAVDKNAFPGVDLNYYAIRIAPNAPALYAEDGSLNWENNTWDNPMANFEQKYRSKFDNLAMNATLSQELIKGLALSLRGGINYGWMDEDRTKPYTMYNPAYDVGPEASSIALSATQRQSWVVEPQLTYKTALNSALTISTLIGATFQSNTDKFLEQSASGFTSNSLIYDIKSASNHNIVNNRELAYKYSALFGRINLAWFNRYFINLTGRRDGSSRFGPGNQFANFGAVGAAWIFSDEAFAQRYLGFLSFGKLRGSYGLTGSDNIGDYKYLDTYSSSTVKYQGKIGLVPTGLFNPNFAWETNAKAEGSLELGFFKNRLTVAGSYYSNRSSNQLVGIPLPRITGFPSIHANLGATVQNTGFEVEMNATNIQTTRFQWTSLFTLTIPRNKLVAFPGLATSTYANQYVIGHPLNISKRYNALGVDAETGVFQFEDVDNDGRLTVEDRQTIVHLNPKFYGGLNNSFSLGKFHLDVFLQLMKQNGRNYFYTFNSPVPGMGGNYPRAFLDRWQQPGDQALLQRLTTGVNAQAVTAYASNMWNSTALISDASYLRLKNINLTYQLPTGWVRGVTGSIFIQGQNLWTMTAYKGADPETNASANASIAPLRMWTTGIQLNF